MFTQNHPTWRAVAVVLMLGAIALFAGCSSKSVSEDVPAGSQVVVSISPAQVTTGSNAVVEAHLTNGGSAVVNQVVTFTVEPSSAGYFSKDTDTTDADGVAATVFNATTSGSVTIRASVSGTTINNTAGVIVTSTGGDQQQTGTASITMTLTPTLLLANGADTAQVTVTVRDQAGNYAPDGTLIKLTAGEKFVDVDGNGYWSQGIDSLVFDANANGSWDAWGLIPSTATVSGGEGKITVNFVAGSDAYTVYIKASVDENGLTGTKDAQIQLSPNASISSIYLQSDSINIVVKQTGGIETTLLHATSYDANGNRVPEGLTVNFVIVDGPGGGEHLGTVGAGPYTAVTNSQGTAACPISAGTVSGTIRIRAYADTVLSNATQIMVSAGPPYDIVLGAEDCNVDAWYEVNRIQKITAIVSDVYNNPVNDSTVVYFTCDEGVMKAHEKRTEDFNGRATSEWYSGDDEASADGVVWIYCETSGGTVRDSSFFYNTGPAASLVVYGMPSSIPADGFTKVGIDIWAYDLNGNPVISGTTYESEATYLNVANGSFEDGCFSSWDRGKITTVTLQIDGSMNGTADNGIGAVDIVRFYAGAGASAVYTVQLTTGNAYSGNSIINGQTNGAPLEVIPYSVTVKDRFGNPLGDHHLTLTATGGTVQQATGVTDAYGEAAGFRWQAPNGIGTFSIVVTDNDPRGGIVLTKSVMIELN